MIKLLIADDEEEIRKGIKSIINWEAYGIEVCGEAENGRETIMLVEQLSPEILLIDIRMPVMDGLQVIETLNSNNAPVKSIILSGYDDFSYAQKALKLGAFDYLLKPCRPEEILETVLKAKSSIEADKSRKETVNKLMSQFNQTLPLLKEKFLAKLVSGERRFRNTIDENFNLYKIKIKPVNVSAIVIRIDNYHLFCKKYNSTDVELLKFAIKNISEEIIGQSYQCEAFESNDDIIIIANIEADSDKSGISSLLGEVKNNINKYLGFTVSIGVGKTYEDIKDVHLSYIEALKSVEEKFIMGDNVIIVYEDIRGADVENFHYPLNEEKQILNCIKTGNGDELSERLEDFFASLSRGKTSKNYALKCGLALSLSIYHLCIEKNIDAEEVFGRGFLAFDNLLKLDTLIQLKEHLQQISKLALEKINGRKIGNKIVEAALKFIEENYNNDLNLETVAGSVFITPSYLSLLFRQIMGINFVDYLHKVRIEKACELLKDIHLKTYEVAYKVGYNDEKYFSQIFKKHMGMTPSQYRENSS